MIQMVHIPIKSKSTMLPEAFADQQRAAFDELLDCLSGGYHIAGSSQVESSDASYHVMVLSNHEPARPASKQSAPVSTAHRL